MQYIRADRLHFDPRPQISRIFVEGFYPWISRFSKDKDKLTEIFTHVFLLENFYLAVENETVTSMTACTKGVAPIKFDRRIFVKILGFFRGNFMYFVLNRYMVRNGYPFPLGRDTGSVEFVATAPDFRGRGIAGGLITFVMEETPYEEYILEVADTNSAAMHLYEKLGFKEIKRVKAPRRSGVNFFIYMRRQANA